MDEPEPEPGAPGVTVPLFGVLVPLFIGFVPLFTGLLSIGLFPGVSVPLGGVVVPGVTDSGVVEGLSVLLPLG